MVHKELTEFPVQVVPTIYTDIRGHNIHSNQVRGTIEICATFYIPSTLISFCYFHLQFSVTEHFRDGNILPKPQPGVFFFYDFSPIKVIMEYVFILINSQLIFLLVQLSLL